MAARHEFIARVTRLFVTEGRTNIRLDLPTAQQPENNYFVLYQKHENYNALYSLALTAAVNGYDLRIRTTADINPGEHAEVEYMVVDW
jgi:hypothetical protein